ncbi:WecB/TagA/CpsF family glycosyltransferase [Brevibacillus dissolubilis]|uniref:WecB/TagA/CpsF family glycosyltransferase n=1 Tax=Brevibacillus dissolubilis TaxID=1844116 RepID=UPI001115B401|nr:WecB/TagA/CpsF family glycosyltransferase [Brevibacillus dissolubilis]
MKVARILGVPFQTKGRQDTITELTSRVQQEERTHVVTANPEIVMAANENPDLASIFDQAYIVPDGIGIVYAAKWTNLPIYERVTGIELLEGLMEQANQHGWRVYLFGAGPEINQLAAENLAKRYPKAQIVGRRDGYFGPADEIGIAQEIAAARPHLLFVALGAPKQDMWIAKYWDQLQVPLAMGVGGSFDVISGKVKRAPVIWQKLHLEWLYRLLKQPSRWKRQLSIPRFIVSVWLDRRK